ncbi:MAG: histidine--tRNA ligase [Eubacteriaceae bacterium]|nr:histidine--tRNA ligase [Eubacteriaceae bacterium]
MADTVQPRTLPGFMELMPPEQQLFEKIKGILEETYRSYGFFALDTPILEHSDILLAKAGGETEKQIYRFSKGDTDLTMRFDLTVPLAKYVAMHQNELAFPFRRYQIGKVYRGERAQKGRYREFYQADIDVIGDGTLGIINDAEIPSIICDIFRKLGIEGFTIRMNNRKVLNGIFEVYGVRDRATDVMRIIDKLDKIGREKVIEELSGIGMYEARAGELLDFLALKLTNDEILEKLGSLSGKSATLDEGTGELSTLLKYAALLGVPSENMRIDLTIARGLDYYTGTVYETIINSHPEIGSVCSGGRYDNLAEYYTSRKLPGVGMSIGLTRLFYVLDANDFIDRSFSSPADVLIIPMTDDVEGAVRLSVDLRSRGIRTQVYLEDKKFKQKMTYADRLGMPFVAILGEDEIAQGKLSLKDMNSGEQILASPDEAAEKILSRIGELSEAKVLHID